MFHMTDTLVTVVWQGRRIRRREAMEGLTWMSRRTMDAFWDQHSFARGTGSACGGAGKTVAGRKHADSTG